MKLLSTSEAAAALNLTIGRVQQLIWEGRLPAQMIGNRYVVNENDLKLVKGIKRGRPPKNTTDTTRQLNRAFRQATEADKKAGKKRGRRK
jgi:excisionase family DNA binding protein